MATKSQTLSPLLHPRYGAIFTATDKARMGALAGAQARSILLQSGLPQNILAQIWTLSDVDKDGRLSREEFILSGHLCDLAAKVKIGPIGRFLVESSQISINRLEIIVTTKKKRGKKEKSTKI